MISDRAVAWIIYVVLAVWSIGMLASMWPHSTYRMDPIVHGIFSATVVAALTYRMKKDSTRESDDSSGSHRK